VLVINYKIMTPEKFQLLRDWVRAEIRSVMIDEDLDALKESEVAFLRVMQAFCGGQVLL